MLGNTEGRRGASRLLAGGFAAVAIVVFLSASAHYLQKSSVGAGLLIGSIFLIVCLRLSRKTSNRDAPLFSHAAPHRVDVEVAQGSLNVAATNNYQQTAQKRTSLPDGHDEKYDDLRARLVDILGGSSGAGDEEALMTMERFGGERSCFTRFLKASQWDPALAEKRIRSTVDFRRQNGINRIFSDARSCEVFERCRPLWPAAVVRFTHDHSPCTFIRIVHFLQMSRMGVPEDDQRLFYFCWMEHLLRVQREGQQRARDGGDSEAELPKCVDIFDLQGIRFYHLREFLGLRVMLQILRYGQDYWPEVLRKAIVVNVPAVGVKLAWSVLQRFCDPDTRAKLTLITGEGRDTLRELLVAPEEEVDAIFNSVVPFKGFSEMPSNLLGGPDLITPAPSTQSTVASSSQVDPPQIGAKRGISTESYRTVSCNSCTVGVSRMQMQLSCALKMRVNGTEEQS